MQAVVAWWRLKPDGELEDVLFAETGRTSIDPAWINDDDYVYLEVIGSMMYFPRTVSDEL